MLSRQGQQDNVQGSNPQEQRRESDPDEQASNSTLCMMPQVSQDTDKCNNSGWVDFSNTMTVFGNSASTWYQEWNRNANESEERAHVAPTESTITPMLDLAFAKQKSVEIQGSHRMLRDSSKLSRATTESSSSSGKNEILTNNKLGRKKSGWLPFQDESSQNFEDDIILEEPSCFQSYFLKRPISYKLTVVALFIVILVCGVLVGLASTSIHETNQSLQQVQTSNTDAPSISNMKVSSPPQSPVTATIPLSTPGPTDTPTMRNPASSPIDSTTTWNPTASLTSSPTTKKPTPSPTPEPTTKNPTSSPTTSPTTANPTSSPTTSPTTAKPTSSPTISPTTAKPTLSPTFSPTLSPTDVPTTTNPTSPPTSNTPLIDIPGVSGITYVPGKLTVKSNGLLLSEGLTSRIVAKTGKKVNLFGLLDNEGVPFQSQEVFHDEPDGAAVFEWAETGGWVYVSNSEVIERGGGGVSAIYFDKDGKVIDYQHLLTGTTHNCSGGKTPWGTWATCEETNDGRIYQVDPFGIRPAEEMTIGKEGGHWEAFAYDIRNPAKPRFFATEDSNTGALRRFTPNETEWEDPWNILQADGIVDYLLLQPATGTFIWTDDKSAAKENAKDFYRNTEGLDVHLNQLFMTSKEQKELFILDLDDMTYQSHSTVYGAFEGQPDQVKRLAQDGLLYFCEEGGRENGVHARDENGWFYTILESNELNDETSGLAFSPDGKHMYVSYQHNGIIFDVWREDGLPFYGRTLDIKYHELRDSTS